MQTARNKSGNQISYTSAPEDSLQITTIQYLVQQGVEEFNIVKTCEHFKMIWITSGKGSCWIDLQKFTFENNQVFFIKPGQMHLLEPLDQLEGYIISFSESFLTAERHESDFTYHDNIFKLFIKAKGVKVTEASTEEIEELVKKMIREETGNNMFREEMLRRYLKILFIHLSRQIEGSLQLTGKTRNAEIVEQFMALLDQHYRTEKMVSGYAGLLSVTPNYLNEIVKKTTGHSARHHIRQRIVFEAKRQATYTNTCMKQIGYYLGFEDMAHFSKYFKTATGMNFTEYKKEKLEVSIVNA